MNIRSSMIIKKFCSQIVVQFIVGVNTMFKEFVFWLLVAFFIIQIQGKKCEIQQIHQLQKLLTQLANNKKALLCLCDTENSRKTDTNSDKAVHGYVYTRWGRKTCGDNHELIYAGQVAGSDYRHYGAAVNYLCLPQTPIYGHYDSKENRHAYVYGAEIDLWKTDIPGTPFEHAKYDQKSIYCAVCRTAGRSSVVMIPGRNKCFPGWTREYHGYLSAGHHAHKGASEYICLDEKPDIFPIKSHSWQKILISVEGRCTGPLKCPPYVNGRELTCVVCSK